MANHACAQEEIININTMASENIKSIEEMRKKHEKDMTEKADTESMLKRYCWINEKALNKIENSSGQVAYFHMKIKGLNNVNHNIQHECLGKFEILESKIWDEVMTT